MDIKVTQIDVFQLKIHEKNKIYFDDIKGINYERFKKSIEEEGIITPLIISPDMTIISGHQRYKAACDLGLKKVPIIINYSLMDENDKLKKLLASNFGRIKNNPMKQSRILVEYENLCGVKRGNPNLLEKAPLKTQKEIAREFGISIDTLKRLKNLQRLDTNVQKKIENEELNYTTALKVFGPLSYEKQKRIMQKLSDVNLKGISAPKLKKIISEEYSTDELTGAIDTENLNKKIKATCTHMLKELSVSVASLLKLEKKLDNLVSKKNRKYIETNIEASKELLEVLKDSYMEK